MDTIQQKKNVADLFDRAALTYGTGDDFFAEVGRDLIAYAAPQYGERVLDIGCGRGAVLFPAAESVGPAGRVAGIDLSPKMVQFTRAEAERLGLTTLEVSVGDAEAPDFPVQSFDLVTAGMVMFFLPDVPAALRCYARLLRPGGRFAMSTFVANDRLRWQPVERALTDLMPVAPPPAPRPHLDPRGWSDALLVHLADCGYTDVSVQEKHYDNVFDTPERWWDWTASMATRAAIEAIPEGRRDEAKRAAFAALDAIRDESGRIVWSAVMRFTKAFTPQRSHHFPKG